jgi:hypothetical protein
MSQCSQISDPSIQPYCLNSRLTGEHVEIFARIDGVIDVLQDLACEQNTFPTQTSIVLGRHSISRSSRSGLMVSRRDVRMGGCWLLTGFLELVGCPGE